ncbi:MAG TPA: ABC transporter permease [Vicinamibacteria bacterium]|nr:ABC transporter permease [Vicinamibacteria bacterium]
MRRYLLKRFALAAATVLFLATAMFILFRMLPGDPTMTVLSPALHPDTQRELRGRFALDKPLPEQYVTYMANVLRLDFGLSFQHGTSAIAIIAEKLRNTLVLMVPSLLLAYAGGVLLGAYIAWKRGTRTELFVTTAAIVFRSGPLFWVALLFVLVFAIHLPVFPAGHMRTPGSGADGVWETFVSLDFLHHLILPMLCMAVYYGCYPLLIMRTSMLEVLGEDFIDLSRAKGLSERRVVFGHALRASLLPIATSISLLGAYAAAGSVLVEMVFSWPGLGRLMVSSVVDSDYPVAQGAFLLIGVLVVAGNLTADLLYGVLDPRIRYR